MSTNIHIKLTAQYLYFQLPMHLHALYKWSGNVYKKCDARAYDTHVDQAIFSIHSMHHPIARASGKYRKCRCNSLFWGMEWQRWISFLVRFVCEEEQFLWVASKESGLKLSLKKCGASLAKSPFCCNILSSRGQCARALHMPTGKKQWLWWGSQSSILAILSSNLRICAWTCQQDPGLPWATFPHCLSSVPNILEKPVL